MSKSGAFFMYFTALHRFYTGLLFDFTNRCYPFLVNKKALRHKKEKRNYIMKKKTVVSLAVATILALTSLTGCGNSRLSGTVATDGSTSMEKVIGALGESFMNENDGIQFTYNPTGSGSGITAVSEGRCDIGLSSRSLKDEEKTQGLTETVLALDGIAVVVNPENQVNDLSIEQIASIYTGEITNWSEVGGADAEIVVIGREAGSGTRDGFESITKTSEKCQYRQELTSTGDVITTVSQNPDAIGYTSLSAVKDNVKALSVGGVAPSEETVKDGSYAIQRPFVLVTKDGVKLSDAAQAFFDYVTSDKVADIITDAGVVPAK
jgi:phosphate transport system substrate-binding protein